MSIINRRMLFSKVMGLLAVFNLSRVQAKVEVTWPSNSVIGSIRKQTDELVEALRRGDIINCRPGVFVIYNPIRLDVKNIDIRGSQGQDKTELHFLNEKQGGLAFRGAINVNISDVHLYWQPVNRQARHHGGAGLMLIKSTKISVSRSSVHGAPGAGFHFNQCNDVRAIELFVENTLADGVHFQNTSNCYGYSLTTSNTGDDGVAIVDYLRLPKSHGFHLEKIRVVESKARGISFVGARNGVLKDFFIDKTATNGLHIEQDSHYKTRFPEDIQVFSGVIDGTGYRSNFNNKFGINVLRAKNVALNNIEVMNSLKFGCFIKDSQNIELKDCSFRNSMGASLYILNAVDLILSNIYLIGMHSPFVQIIGVDSLIADSVTIVDQTNDLETTVLGLYSSKINVLKDISIINLVLNSQEGALNKVFIIKASEVENVSIHYASQYQVKVMGSRRNFRLLKK